MSLWHELRRRNVFKVAAAYAIVAWLLSQIADLIFPILLLPDWILRAVVAVLLLGFPVAVLLAWAYEVTPDGIKQTESVPLAESIRDLTGRRINYILAVLLVIAVLYIAIENRLPRPRDMDRIPEETPAVALESPPATVTDTPNRLPNSVAVLPFVNLSPNADDAYFAAGVHEQILNELARIRDMSVIARTSVLRYASDPPPVPQIAEELNVETIMEGSVRYSGEKVRVTAQPIDGMTGAHLWTEDYDGDLSDIFAIQTDIATAIASALETELLPAERAQLEQPPTESTAAYALFLEARNLFTATSGDILGAIDLLDRALALDPDFALAYGLRATIRAYTLINSAVVAPSDPTIVTENKRQTLEDADRALALDDTVGYAWLARGLVAQLSWRWLDADEVYARALALEPNNSNILRNYAWLKVFAGEYEEGMRLARRQAELSPNDPLTYTFLNQAAVYSRQWDEALEAALTLAEMAPTNVLNIVVFGHLHRMKNEFEKAAASLRMAEELISSTGGSHTFLPGIIYSYGLIGREQDAMRAFDTYQSTVDHATVGAGDWTMAYLGIRDFDSAYAWLSRAVARAERHELDAGFFALTLVRTNVNDDPVLEQPRFRELRERLGRAANSR